MKHTLRYKRYDLGKQLAGTIVEVVLSCVNNVRLMDHANFKLYSAGKDFKAVGGRIERSPTRLIVPTDGRWHVVVDKTGFHILANSNVRAIPPYGVIATPSAAEASMLSMEFAADRRPRADSEGVVVTQILRELNTYKQIANTDMLTGLANRRAFDARMGDIYRDPQRRAATALILADVDNFKTFNDTFGHAIGDTVLRTVAETIRATLPHNAFPARTGGEEFAIIVEDVRPEQAIEIAEAARRAIEATLFLDTPTGTDCGKVTISLGLCMADQARTAADLYHGADLALYASKKAGRNRCTVSAGLALDNAAPAAADTPVIRQEPVIYEPRTSRVSSG
ncbi:MAG: DUF1883 domain-containing protein [Hoeflea sp.]|nr:DUF1883 domain-containing protein [Hoeflea sp.]